MPGDVYGTVRVAAVQAASVFLDREASTAKACELIRRAGADFDTVASQPAALANGEEPPRLAAPRPVLTEGDGDA